jgi:hypothetical protein
MEVEANQQNPMDGRNKIDSGDYFVHGLAGGGKKKRGVDEADLGGMVQLVLNHLKEGHKLPEIKKQLKLEHPHATAKNIAEAVKMGKSQKKGGGATPSMGVSQMRGGGTVKQNTAAKRAVNLGLADMRALEEEAAAANPLAGGARKTSLTAPESLLRRARDRQRVKKLIAKHGDRTPPAAATRSEPPQMNRQRISTLAQTMVLPQRAVPFAIMMDQLGLAPEDRGPNATGQGKKRLSKEEFLKRMAAGKAKKRGGSAVPSSGLSERRGGAKRRLEKDESYGEIDESHPGDKFLSEAALGAIRSKAREEKKKRVDARIAAAPRTQAMVKAAVGMVKGTSGKGLVGGTKREQWKIKAKKIFEDLWEERKGELSDNEDEDYDAHDKKFDALWDKVQDEAMAKAAKELKYNPDNDDKAWRPAGKVKYNAKKEPVYGQGYGSGSSSDSSSSGSDSDDSMCGGRKSGMKFIKDVVAHMKVGAFTKEAKRHKMGVEQFADEVLSHPKKYKLTTRRRAQFLVNIRRKKGKGHEQSRESGEADASIIKTTNPLRRVLEKQKKEAQEALDRGVAFDTVAEDLSDRQIASLVRQTKAEFPEDKYYNFWREVLNATEGLIEVTKDGQPHWIKLKSDPPARLMYVGPDMVAQLVDKKTGTVLSKATSTGKGHMVGGAMDEFLEAKLRVPPPAVKGGRRGKGVYMPGSEAAPKPAAPERTLSDKIKNEFTNPNSVLRSKVLPGLAGATALGSVGMLGKNIYDLSTQIRAGQAAQDLAAAVRRGAENIGRMGVGVAEDVLDNPVLAAEDFGMFIEANPELLVLGAGKKRSKVSKKKLMALFKKHGAGYYVGQPPPTAPPSKPPSLGEKIKNEFVNPQSKLRSTLGKVKNEFVNRESKLRSKILPTAANVAGYAQVPLNIAGAYFGNPLLGTQIDRGLSAINTANTQVSNVQRALGAGKKRKGPVLRGDTLVLEGGKKRRAKASPSDGRRKRASIVAEVMKKRGVSLIEASKIVKSEGLY